MLAGDHKASVLSSTSTTRRVDFSYTAYGHREDESSGSGALGFNGELREGDGGYFLGHGNRVFSPLLMRFQTPDDLSPFKRGGINTYAYCEGEPINYLDSTGNYRFFHWLGKRLGVASSSRSTTKYAKNETSKSNGNKNTSSQRLFNEDTLSFSDELAAPSPARRQEKPIPQGLIDYTMRLIEEGDPFNPRNEHNKLSYRIGFVEELPATPPGIRRQLAIENAPIASTSTPLPEQQTFIRMRVKNKKPKVIDQARNRHYR